MGSAKQRVLENQKRREQEAQNIVESVKQLIQANELEVAKEQTRLVYGKHRDKCSELLKGATPEPDKKCEKCKEKIQYFFDQFTLEWFALECWKCQYNEIKKQIADDCQEIMLQRGIAARFLFASLGDFDRKYQKQLKPHKGFFLYGPRGTGKSHLMAALMKRDIINAEPQEGWMNVAGDVSEVHYNKPPIRNFPHFISVPELLLKIRETFNHNNSATEAEIIETYSNAKILYLDDLGTEKPTDWAISTLYLLIDRRYSAMRRTVISSNLSLDELADRLDDRISSRIAGMCEVIKMEGKDRRLK